MPIPKVLVGRVNAAMSAVVAFGAFLLFAPAASAQSPRTQAQSLAFVDGMTYDTTTNLINTADIYYHHGDYHRVIGEDRVVAEMDPTYLESYSDGGWLMESLGDTKDAEAFYELGVARNRTKSYMAYQLGFFYFNTLHNYQKSAAVMRQCIKLADSSDLDFKLLAHTYTRMKDYKDALAMWKVIKQKFPNAQAVDHNLQEAQAAYNSATSGDKTTQ